MMITVTVEFPTKTIHKQFPTDKDAQAFLWGLRGQFLGYYDDGTFAIWRG